MTVGFSKYPRHFATVTPTKEQIMKSLLLSTALLAAGSAAATSAPAGEFDGFDRDRPLTVAVFGDWPYNQNLLDNAPLLIDSVNADPKVSLVIHVGDIHSGSMACTSAGNLPPIAASNPGWNQGIYYQFQQFKDPLVYTPGDNEWTDCHKSKEKSSGDPLKELASIRSLFFAKPGHTLGMKERIVHTQAEEFDPGYPVDALYVENVMWEDAGVVFVTVNMPGSNNDIVPWSGTFANPAAQAQEVADRTAADMRWLQRAFAEANEDHAKAVVIAQQADMWDPEALANNALSGYTAFVQKLADLSVAFGRPVLLLNGDSHVYEADHPLAAPSNATGVIHGTQAVPNLTRITVQGSTKAPAEWLRLTIDPRKPEVFSWENVPYCNDPLSACQ
jgi:hypothetical protein